MGSFNGNFLRRKKRVRASERPFTAPLFLLRCLQTGLHLSDLDYVTVGMAIDIYTESANDKYDWDELATAEDVAAF